ncbi:heme-binding protein 2-like [Acanthaster planci]|uniref:Heme-binding protein 2-like n=1 Tax=Acanthaster planci TaxID=133434 RepID=A0A8B8A1I9_ACAPL|nr:heme-binding protein 2-like [Acanthaster planci]
MFSAIKSVVASLESPSYTVEPQDPQKPLPYEVRNYAKSTWVTTSESTIEGPSTERSNKNRRDMFFKLFDYISGKNEKNEKIEMTVPVLRKITPGAGPFCKTTKDMSFYVTEEFQGDPPAPSNEDVYVTHLPAQRVVVKTFSGYTTEAKDLEEATQLAELTKDKYDLEQNYFFAAGYNSPWRFVGRRNEVWFVVKGERQNGDAVDRCTLEKGAAGEEGTAVDKPAETAAE